MKSSNFTGTDAPARVSDVLIALFNSGDPDDRVTVADLIGALHERAAGIGILLFAVPNAVPLPGIPGVSAVLGPPDSLALQPARATDLWLPQWMLKQSLRRVITRDFFINSCRDCCGWSAPLNHGCADLPLTARDRIVAFAIFAVLGTILALPIIFGNLLPAGRLFSWPWVYRRRWGGGINWQRGRDLGRR